MSSDPTVAYLDANVLLAYISAEEDRVDVVERLLTGAADGKVQLRTSTLSIVEVAFGATEASVGRLDDSIEEAIDSLWMPGSPIGLVEPSVAIMRTARRYLRDSISDERSLKPADAVHLATAVAQADTTHLFTYEGQGRRDYWATLTGLAVVEPFVSEMPLPFDE